MYQTIQLSIMNKMRISRHVKVIFYFLGYNYIDIFPLIINLIHLHQSHKDNFLKELPIRNPTSCFIFSVMSIFLVQGSSGPKVCDSIVGLVKEALDKDHQQKSVVVAQLVSTLHATNQERQQDTPDEGSKRGVARICDRGVFIFHFHLGMPHGLELCMHGPHVPAHAPCACCTHMG